mgnify:CR=1 FL=1
MTTAGGLLLLYGIIWLISKKFPEFGEKLLFLGIRAGFGIGGIFIILLGGSLASDTYLLTGLGLIQFIAGISLLFLGFGLIKVAFTGFEEKEENYI